jgi:hypothetical protein
MAGAVLSPSKCRYSDLGNSSKSLSISAYGRLVMRKLSFEEAFAKI